jgi:hypothetical protein
MKTEWIKSYRGISSCEDKWSCLSCSRLCVHSGAIQPDSCLYENSLTDQQKEEILAKQKSKEVK